MYNYAQLNDENVVIGISQLTGEVLADNMILINELDVELGSAYNHKTGEFTPPKQRAEPIETLSTLEEMQLEQLYQTALLEMTLL